MASSILHTTDTFLDRKNMGRKQRRQDYLQAFKQAIAYALGEDVDGVIHTGNLFWTKSPPAEVVEECRELLARLNDAGIPFWLLYGNRDQDLAVLREFQEEGLLQRLEAEWQIVADVAVCGIDSETSVGDLKQVDPAPPRQARIVCSCEKVEVPHLRDVIRTDVDAVLLGDQNGPVDQMESDCRIVSPGSPERVLGKWMTKPGESEWDHPRRVNIYTITEDSISTESKHLETRDYEGIALETNESTTMADIQHRLDQVDLAGKAALLILRGKKGSNTPSRKNIQKELDNRCEIARVYDRRDGTPEPAEHVDNSSGRADGVEGSGLSSNQPPEGSTFEGKSDTEMVSAAGRSDELHQPIEGQTIPSASIEFTSDELAKLGTSEEESPDSAHVAAKFESLQTRVETAFANTTWFDSFMWQGNPGSPYIGPHDPEQSKYVWLGLAHEKYQTLGKPSGGLQIEFGIDTGSARGFFDRSVICGLYFGPWADDPEVSKIADRIRANCSDLAAFLENHPEYVLATKDNVWESPAPETIADETAALTGGFTLTVDCTLDDLCAQDKITEQVCRVIYEVLPLYAKLAGVGELEGVPEFEPDQDVDIHQLRGTEIEPQSDRSTASINDVELTIESIASYSSLLDAENIRTTIDTLGEQGASRKEALQHVRQYAVDMERGEGLYAVKGLGPVTGHSLAKAGITDLEDLLATSISDLETIERVRDRQAEKILENARDMDSTSTAVSSDDSRSTSDADLSSAIATDEQENANTSAQPDGTTDSSTRQSGNNLPNLTFKGEELQANQLSEYYEAIRCVRKVVETVMQLEGTDIDPEDLTDPRIQYYVMLDACIGLEYPDVMFTGYGKQHQDRLQFSIREYRHAFGNGEWVTDYHAIAVAPYCDETQSWLTEHTWLEDVQQFVRPCSPDDDCPLPEMVGSLDDLRHALAILDTLPAYPPLPTETGTTDRTIPIESLYQDLFADVADDHLVDVETLSGPGQATGDPITGPVAEATPTSQTDAEAFLLDYGKLTHLFQRVKPPAGSPIQQQLPVFALDWYRPNSGSFDELQALAKHGRDEPIATFRPRLQDMIHRRFLSDRWNYDYITVFPGHEAGQLSPQLVELAQDGVIETSIIYTPLLERTETTERQREKSQEERKDVAKHPGKTLRSRATLDGETVILFDDICTTGNSLLAGANLLREAGAGRVIGLTLGFTPGGSETKVKEIKKPDTFASDIIAGLE